MKGLKKLILLVSLSLALVACSQGGEETEKSEEKTEEAAVEVDKKLLSKDITISKDFLDLAEVEDPQESIDNLVEEGKIKSGKVNSDGSITYSMTSDQHKDFMKAIKEGLDESNQELIDDESNSIVDIDYKDDMSEFNVYVDPNSYTELDSFNALTFYIQGAYYRMFNGDDDKNVLVNFIDKDTDEILNTGDSSSLLEEGADPSEDPSQGQAEDLQVKAEDLPYTIEEEEPDSLGNVYGKASYENNSDYPVTYFELEGTIPSTNEKTYLTSSDTVMPGETSSNFEGFYEEGTPIEKIYYSYDKDDREIYVEYDVKLDSYDFY